MDTRIVARSTAAAAAAALLAVAAGAPAQAAPLALGPKGGQFADSYPLPNGFQPEGIAIDNRGTAYFGSLADGDVYALDLRTGEGGVISEGPGIPAAGLKVDRFDRLYLSGGPTGIARVVDASTGEELASYQLGTAPTFVNDVVLTKDAAWFTDSQRAQLYKLPFGRGGALPDPSEIETLPLTGDWQQTTGFNANGIAQTPDRRALLVVQSATGLLFRVDPATGVAEQVDLGGELVTNGDGILVEGRTLSVVQNRQNTVAEFELSRDGRSGELVERITSPLFDVPTTVAEYRGDLFLPNARFGTPPTPETTYDVIRVDG